MVPSNRLINAVELRLPNDAADAVLRSFREIRGRLLADNIEPSSFAELDPKSLEGLDNRDYRRMPSYVIRGALDEFRAALDSYSLQLLTPQQVVAQGRIDPDMLTSVRVTTSPDVIASMLVQFDAQARES